MVHAVAILFGLLAVGAGVLILVLTHAATTPAIIAGVLIVIGMFAAIPAQMTTAREELTKFWRAYKNPAKDA